MRSLAQVALDAVRQGATTLAEIERVIGFADFAPKVTARRILVVDDDPVIRELTAAVLKAQGFAVVEAADGEAGFAIATVGDAFDLAVCDIDMPGISGGELLRRLRAHHATARLPVIIQTGSSSHELEVNLIDAGADDYVRKPVDPARLIARVNAVLRRTAQR
jgi:DNA-binding response OmpR family regulator